MQSSIYAFQAYNYLRNNSISSVHVLVSCREAWTSLHPVSAEVRDIVLIRFSMERVSLFPLLFTDLNWPQVDAVTLSFPSVAAPSSSLLGL